MKRTTEATIAAVKVRRLYRRMLELEGCRGWPLGGMIDAFGKDGKAVLVGPVAFDWGETATGFNTASTTADGR